MGEITRLYAYPLASAAPQERAHMCNVGPAGLRGDHEYVAYDPATYKRLGAKELPSLMGARVDSLPDWVAIHHPGNNPLMVDTDVFRTEGFIDEFGDRTPVLTAGEGTAAELSERLGRPAGLARKTAEWMAGGVIAPKSRRIAPLHIVNADTIAALQENDRGVSFDHRRFRPNIVIRGFEPFAEAAWAGRLLDIGGLVVHITRLTERCPVPGYDPITGEKLGDVPKLYPRFARPPGGGKPTFGVYGYPLNTANNRDISLDYGDPVELLDVTVQ